MNLDNIFETFIKIPSDLQKPKFIRYVGDNIVPLISKLKKDSIIDWFSFLVHDKTGGVPTTNDDNSSYIHIRLELNAKKKDSDLFEALPSDCLFTRKVDRKTLEEIDGIDKTMLKDNNIEEAWKLIGETSTFIIRMFEAHNNSISQLQVDQFLHFLANSLQTDIKL